MSEENLIINEVIFFFLFFLCINFFILSLFSFQIQSEKFLENRLIRGLESRLQLLQIDLTTVNEQLKNSSLENLKIQREIIILKRDKIELNEEITNLKSQIKEEKERNELLGPQIKELSQLLVIAETKLQSQVFSSLLFFILCLLFYFISLI